jgi:hypothetical protein
MARKKFEDQDTKKILITGSSNMIAKTIEGIATEKCFEIQKIGLSASGSNFVDILDETTWPESIEADLVIHTSWIMTPRNHYVAEANINFSEHILDLSIKSGVRLVFVSTMSAMESANSIYGKSKYAVEEMYRESNAQVIRVGLLQESNTKLDLGSASRILKCLLYIPIRMEFTKSPHIPVCSTDYLKVQLAKIILSAKESNFDIVERTVNFNDLITKPNRLIKVKLSSSAVTHLLYTGSKFSKKIADLNDRWLSLLDTRSW